MSEYPPPVHQLLQLGRDEPEQPLRNYPAELGLTAEHIPALVQLATNKELCVDWREPDSWAVGHAMLALAQLRAWDYLGRVLDFINELDREDLSGDWVSEELPHFYAAFGDEIVPILKSELRRTDRTSWFRAATAEALEAWAQKAPERRAEAIEAFVAELETSEPSDPELNALLIAQLAHMKAIEAAPAIERAFAAGRVDETFLGNWEWVRFDMGLGPKPAGHRYQFLSGMPPLTGDRPRHPKARAEERKAKRKAAKRARKRGRR